MLALEVRNQNNRKQKHVVNREDQFYADMTAAAYTQTDADAACFMKTVEALLGLVKGTSAWASLPEPNAAYE